MFVLKDKTCDKNTELYHAYLSPFLPEYCWKTFSKDLIWFCHDYSLQMSQRRNGSKMPVVLSWFREWMGRSLCQGRCWQKIWFLLLSHYLFMNMNPYSAFPLSFDYRALGDFEYKNVDGKGPTEQLVSPEPEFYIKVRKQRPCFRTLINLEIILVGFTSSRSSPKPCFSGC